ncbi:MAG: 30S ribosomal protein S12 methylthiotransferase RimO, partial [Clostridia bacterium]|nr:30S ribosomal protein S12 methylthiotransferase RimO [Clostridia bacterium]
MIDFSQKKFGLISLGCDKNRVDSEKLLAIIKEKGCIITDCVEEAHIIIVNTCAFLNESRKEAIETVLDCAAYKSENLEKLVVTGCLPQKFIGETFNALDEADVFLGTRDYDKLFEALEKSYEGDRVNFVGCGNGCFLSDRLITTPQHYAYLKIAEGCSNRCAYCLIPDIRGKYESFLMEKLLEEAASLGEVAELIIVAQDITRYGIDLYGKKKLK